MGLLVFVPHLFHDADEVLQAKHVTSVWPIMHSGIIPETLERAVCKVDHADVHLGWRGRACLGARARAGAGATGGGHLRKPRVQVLEAHFRPAVQVGVRTALFAIIDDKQGTGVEAVGGLPLQDSF